MEHKGGIHSAEKSKVCRDSLCLGRPGSAVSCYPRVQRGGACDALTGQPQGLRARRFRPRQYWCWTHSHPIPCPSPAHRWGLGVWALWLSFGWSVVVLAGIRAFVRVGRGGGSAAPFHSSFCADRPSRPAGTSETSWANTQRRWRTFIRPSLGTPRTWRRCTIWRMRSTVWEVVLWPRAAASLHLLWPLWPMLVSLPLPGWGTRVIVRVPVSVFPHTLAPPPPRIYESQCRYWAPRKFSPTRHMAHCDERDEAIIFAPPPPAPHPPLREFCQILRGWTFPPPSSPTQ